MKVGLISGAFSGDSRWDNLKAELPAYLEPFHIPYNPLIKIADTISSLEDQLRSEDQVILIGHSLGGVIAAELTRRLPNIARSVTVASPFGGISCAMLMSSMLKLMAPYNTFWDNIHKDHDILKTIRAGEYYHPMLCVAVENLPYFASSDGVVTLKSQYALQGKHNVAYTLCNAGHSEAVEDEDVISEITKFLSLAPCQIHRTFNAKPFVIN